jgi:hypothetical protein
MSAKNRRAALKKAINEDSSEESEDVKKVIKKDTRKKPNKKAINEDSSEESEDVKKVIKKDTRKKPNKKNNKREDIPEPTSKSKKTIKKNTKKSNDESDEEIVVKKKRGRPPTKKKRKDSESEDDLPVEVPQEPYIVNKNMLFDAKTRHTAAFKQMIDRMASTVSDCLFTIIQPQKKPKEDDDHNDYYEEDTNISSKDIKKIGGITGCRVSESVSVLIKVLLYANEFEHFHCAEKKLEIGIDILNLNKALKNLDDSLPMTMYIAKNNPDILYIKNTTITLDKTLKEERQISLKLIYVETCEDNLKKADDIRMLILQTRKLMATCKNMATSTGSIQMRYVDGSISFHSEETSSFTVENSFSKVNDDTVKKSKKKKEPEIIQGNFDLKIISNFSKCNKMSKTIKLYIKNDYPLIMHISVATLGSMFVFVAPKLDEEDKDENY